jgi:tetratricopeptide (TPR) repeat protein
MRRIRQNDPGKRRVVLGTTIFITVIIVGALCFLGIVEYQKDSERNALAREIAEFGPRKGVPKTIADLQRAIKAYEKQMDIHIRDAKQLGTYWKILGTRFRDKGMHMEALAAYQHAMEYNTDEAVLYYLTGVEAGLAGKAAVTKGEVDRFFDIAERAYVHAIELDETYNQALYGLGVLYCYQLDRPADAVPRIRRYMELRSGDVDAMFVLARAYYMLGDFSRANEQYDEIINSSKDRSKRDEAMENKAYIRDLMR